MPIGQIPNALRLGVSNVSVPYAKLGPNSQATAGFLRKILSVSENVPLYQGVLSRASSIGLGNADWNCNNPDNSTGETTYIRQISPADTRFARRNWSDQPVSTQGIIKSPTRYFSGPTSAPGHRQNHLNQIYYVMNEPDSGCPLNLVSGGGCSDCVTNARRTSAWDSNLTPFLTTAGEVFWEPGNDPLPVTSCDNTSAVERIRAEALAIAYKRARADASVHTVLMPSSTDPFRVNWTRSYYQRFFTKVHSNQGTNLGAVSSTDLKVLHFHCYSSVPTFNVGQAQTPLQSVAYSVAQIIHGLNWYRNTYNSGQPLPMSVLVSEFGPWWLAKYQIEYGVDYRPRTIAGFWPDFRKGLTWWNSMLYWLTRRAPIDCQLQGWNTATWESIPNALYACLHEADLSPFVVVNGTTQSTGRNQWYFNADVMAKSFIQNAVGFTNANFYPGSPIQGNLVAASTSNLIYEPSFTSFITPSSPGITYNDPIWGTRKFHRTPLGACYAVWSDPRVASGSLGTDLNSKWVASSSSGVVGTAQVTLLAGYSTVYIPVSNGDINANSQFFVEFSDGISAYIYAGQMNLQDIGGTQSISINVADGTSLDQNDPNVVTQTYYPAMVYPFVCWTSQQKTLTLRVNRTIGSGNALIGPPVVLKGVCSWFITQ